MKPKKIGFLGLFGQQNLGNDCALQAILCHVRKYLPDAEVLCICTGPEDISVRYNISTFPIRVMSDKVWPGQLNFFLKLLRKVFIRIPMELLHWVKAYKALKGTHMLVFPGTGLLIDYSTSPFSYPYYVFKWSIIARLHRSKLLIVSVGAGPIYHPLSRWFIKLGLSLADYRCYRDGFSKQYIEGIGFETKRDLVYPDLAFSLPRAVMPECNNRDRQRPVIGVGLLDYYGQGSLRPSNLRRTSGEEIYSNYLNKVGAFMTWLLENKYTVRVLIGDILYDSSVKQDLMDLLKKHESSFEEGQIINEPIFTVEQLLSQLAGTDIVVSPRFHNIVLALMLNKPVISLSYNEKFDALMNEFGLAEYCQGIDHFDVDKLIEQFIKLEKNAENLKPRIKQKTEEYRRALDEQYAFIFKNA